jgi:hypothetical protein
MAFGSDFRFFWEAASQILRGGSPYNIGGFYSPYPLALLLVPFALLPFTAAFGVWTAFKLFLLAKSGDRLEFLKAVLFFPVAFDLLQGQLDLLVFMTAMPFDWFGVVISAIRPQLALWIIPWKARSWWKTKRFDQFWKSTLGIIILYGASTLIEPGWWMDWFHATSVAWQYNQQSASLFGLAQILPFSHLGVFIGIFILGVFCFVLLRPKTPRSYWQWVALFNPVANIYSLVILFDQVDWVVIILGLLALPLSQWVHTNAIWALIPLYLILKDVVYSRSPKSIPNIPPESNNSLEKIG